MSPGLLGVRSLGGPAGGAQVCVGGGTDPPQWQFATAAQLPSCVQQLTPARTAHLRFLWTEGCTQLSWALCPRG